MKEKVSALKAEGKTGALAVIQVGADPASSVYVRNKKNACAYIGIESLAYGLVLICWVLLWLILLLVKHDNDRKQKIKYTVLVILLLTYALTVHSRLMVLWPAFVLLVIVFYIFYKRVLISLKTGILFGAVSFLAVLKGISFVQTCFWALSR